MSGEARRISADLVALDDSAFAFRWRDISEDERNALPDGVRRECYSRYRRLTPWVGKSIELADRAMARLDAQCAAGIADIDKSEPIQTIPLAEFLARPAQAQTVKYILPRRGEGAIFGEYGSGKSFSVLDLTMAIARRLDSWRGHRVNGGGVVYLVAEGAGGFPKRIGAYCKYHEVDAGEVALELIDARVDLRNPGAQLSALITAIRDAAERIGPIVLIVIDTLTRTMPGGSDSKAEDMSAYVDNCERLGKGVDAFVLIVHHSGKDATKGMRGSTVLPGAIDLEIEVKRDADGNGTLTISKSRDGQDGQEFGFRLEQVELGRDSDDDPITSCVVIPSDAAPRRARQQSLSGVAKAALQALQESVSDHGQVLPESSTVPAGTRAVRIDQWRAQFLIRYGEDDSGKRDAAAVRKAFQRAREALIKVSVIGISNPYCWIAKRLQ